MEFIVIYLAGWAAAIVSLMMGSAMFGAFWLVLHLIALVIWMIICGLTKGQRDAHTNRH